jgi:hypothetical protein
VSFVVKSGSVNHRVFAHPSFSGWIGVARRDITPPPGIYARNWGAALSDQAKGIHRPFCLTAIALSDGPGPPLALLAMDLGWWSEPKTEWSVRKAVIDVLGTDERRVLINLGHTHAGATLFLDRLSEGIGGSEYLLPFLDRIREAASEAALEASESRQPGVLSWSYGRCMLAANRDFPETETARFACGFNPAVEADDTLLVGRATDQDGRIIATIVNYACHPTTLAWQNDLLSPDYVGSMRDVVEGGTGLAPCLFLQGALGELAPREQYSGNTALADRHGRQLGFAVLSTLEGMLPPSTRYVYAGVVESGTPLAVWNYEPYTGSSDVQAMVVTASLPLKDDLPSRTLIEQELARCHDRVVRERWHRRMQVRQAVGDGSEAVLPVWLWKIGDCLLAGCACEAYSWLQRELRRRFPDHAVIVTSLVNGTVGYLPPAELFDFPVYQVQQTPFARGCLETVTEVAAQALRSCVEGRSIPRLSESGKASAASE